MTGHASFFSRLVLSLLFCAFCASAGFAGDKPVPGWITPQHPAVNADNSRQIALAADSYNLFDSSGNLLATLPAEIRFSSEPRWSRSVPSLLYFHSGNQLKSYDVSSGEMSTLQTFSEYGAIAFSGESDTPFDGDRFALTADNRYDFAYSVGSGSRSVVFDTEAGSSPSPLSAGAPAADTISQALLERAGRLLAGVRAAKAPGPGTEEPILPDTAAWAEGPGAGGPAAAASPATLAADNPIPGAAPSQDTTPPPEPRLERVVSAAGATERVCPGFIVSALGNHLSTAVVAATRDLPLPLSLAGTAVNVNGVPAALYYVSPAQIDFEWPLEAGSPAEASVTITVNGATSAPLRFPTSAPTRTE